MLGAIFLVGGIILGLFLIVEWGGSMNKMVVLITGASHTGKTLLAQKLLEKYKYSVLSIDLLKMGLIRSKNTDLTPEDDENWNFIYGKLLRKL